MASLVTMSKHFRELFPTIKPDRIFRIRSNAIRIFVDQDPSNGLIFTYNAPKEWSLETILFNKSNEQRG